MIAQTGDSKAEQAQSTPQVPFAPPPAYGTPGQDGQGPPPTGFPAPQTGMYSGSPAGTPGTPVVVVAQQPQFQSYPSEAARAGAQYQTELMAACAAGRHDPKTNYGVCGIITAIRFASITKTVAHVAECGYDASARTTPHVRLLSESLKNSSKHTAAGAEAVFHTPVDLDTFIVKHDTPQSVSASIFMYILTH